jgi:MscS family membrane protein
MNWTDQLFLSNPVYQWLWTIGIIVVLMIMKNRLSGLMASLLFVPIHRQWKSLEKSSFTGLIGQPLSLFVFLLIAIPSLENLKFPDALNLALNEVTLREVMHRGSWMLMIVSFTWILLRFMDFIALLLDRHAHANRDKRDDQMIVFLRDFIKVLFYIASFLLLLKVGFHVNVGAILTGLSIVGAALALAAKESIENLIASFIIFFDKPFFTGDQVKVSHSSGAQGIIENIGLRSTRIRTPDQTLITVPNKQMVDSVVDNWSMRTARRAEWKLELELQNESNAIRAFMDELSAAIQNNNKIKQHQLWIADIIKNQLHIQLECLTEPIPVEHFQQIKQEINWSIKTLLEKHMLKTPMVEQGKN